MDTRCREIVARKIVSPNWRYKVPEKQQSDGKTGQNQTTV
jgi:hypothetical protein